LVKRRTLCNLSLFFQLFKGGLLESKSTVAENRHRGIKNKGLYQISRYVTLEI
ncbi:hypothetical protein E8M74_04180, partial [Neisseria gonorrhoeae]